MAVLITRDIDIRCEGYYGPNNPYVLNGSCCLNYSLELTSKGEEWMTQKNIDTKKGIFFFIFAMIGLLMIIYEIDRGERARYKSQKY